MTIDKPHPETGFRLEHGLGISLVNITRFYQESDKSRPDEGFVIFKRIRWIWGVDDWQPPNYDTTTINRVRRWEIAFDIPELKRQWESKKQEGLGLIRHTLADAEKKILALETDRIHFLKGLNDTQLMKFPDEVVDSYLDEPEQTLSELFHRGEDSKIETSEQLNTAWDQLTEEFTKDGYHE